MKGQRRSNFSEMTRDELISYCQKLYQSEGIKALSYPELKKKKGLYWNLYSKGTSEGKGCFYL